MAKRKPKPKASRQRRASASRPREPVADLGKPLASDQSSPERTPSFPVVGIGASAGGLEAFSQLLGALPSDTGMAFVLIQHLDPQHESQLPEILSRTTAMPVMSVTHHLSLERDRVYVIPANATMTIDGDTLALTSRSAADRHAPIDDFFRSLARERRERAIGVVLSGTGSDGTIGLGEIKAEGGLAFVQDEKSAKQPGMPHSAAAFADWILAPGEIARELVRISRHPYANAAPPRAVDSAPPEQGAEVRAVLRAVRAVTGVDFSHYKPATLQRRIARRMLLKKIDTVGAYVRHLGQTPPEAQALHDDLLIIVTGFFRNPEGFEALKRSAFPALLKERAAGEPVRVWVPGCATGEEAYSLVICLLEFLEEQDSTLQVQLFGTDLSATAISRARTGSFPARIENEVSPERLRRFFDKKDGRYQINKAIRDRCLFAQQNLTTDPPFSKLDLISCCNVLIYLTTALQERVIPIFHYALKPTGLLKLGASEGVGRFTNLFSPIDRKHKIYAPRPGPSGHVGFGLTATARVAVPAGEPQEAAGWSAGAIEREADRAVLSRHAPAGVVVSSDLEIVQFRGKTGVYLEAPPGVASLSLLRMVRDGLAPSLRRALQEAAHTGAAVKKEGIQIRANGQMQEVGFEVIPIGPADQVKGRHLLVLFFETLGRPRAPVPPTRARESSRGPATVAERRVVHLTHELADARQHLETISEEHAAAIEELRATTEELQSSNEELQSTNEELETAKEELQSANEELTTVNDELQSRNLELGHLSSDLGNLLASIQVPIIMVAMDLGVRRMTPAAERVLNLTPSDLGRPIGHLRLSGDFPALEPLLTSVIESLVEQERELVGRDGRWYSVRVRPYRTVDHKIDGAVVSFVDIDNLRRGLDQARAVVEAVREPLVVLDDDFHVVAANRAFFATYRVRPDEVVRRSLFELGSGQWNIPELRAMLQQVATEGRVVDDFEVAHHFEHIGTRTMLVSARRIPGPSTQPAGILLGVLDATERKRLERVRADQLTHEQSGRAEAEDAIVGRDRFLAVLSHELRTPLNAMLGWVRILRTQKLDEANVAQALEVIERNTLLQARLVEDLLDVSRIVTGTMRLEARPMMVGPVVQSALATMQPTAAAKGVTLDSVIDEDSGAVRGDPARLQQIVWNLIVNGIKFTPSGGQVDVRVARRGATVAIVVRDTGRGIAGQELPGIFNRFGVAHTSTQSQGGMGLGLSIAHHLVQLHGGTLHAESSGLGHGATFTVLLPSVNEGPAEGGGVAEIAAVGLAPGGRSALEGVRILVVDDETDGREMLEAVLVQCGGEVTAVASAQAALEALDRTSFDVLVSDIVMPDQDGYGLIRQVRAREADRGGGIPALALTAYTRIEDREAAISAGFQQHAVKPIEPVEVVAAIVTLIGRGERKGGPPDGAGTGQRQR